METTLTIRNSGGQRIVGILHKLTSVVDGARRPKIGLICHGYLGHKNYLFQPLLAKSLPFDTFRFDFRGNGDSDGESGLINFEDDFEDITTVVKHFEKEGYEIYALIGHSRGAIVSLRYAVTHNRSIPHLVNISARFYMIGLKANHDERIEAMLETQGFYDRHARFNGKQISRKVTKEEVELFCNWDNYFAKDMPLTTSVLTCHGLADTLVPVRDSAAYANLIPIHTLHLIEGADHNYNGCYPELASIVSQYFTNEAAKEAFWQHGAGVTVRVPRWIQVEGVRNFRDLGGWPVRPTSDGVGEGWHFKERMIFRSGDVTNITNEGVMTLYQLNIRTIFDFRSDTEVENAGGVRFVSLLFIVVGCSRSISLFISLAVDPSHLMHAQTRDIPGIQRVAVPIFKSIDYSPEALVIRWQDYFGGADGLSRNPPQRPTALPPDLTAHRAAPALARPRPLHGWKGPHGRPMHAAARFVRRRRRNYMPRVRADRARVLGGGRKGRAARQDTEQDARGYSAGHPVCSVRRHACHAAALPPDLRFVRGVRVRTVRDEYGRGRSTEEGAGVQEGHGGGSVREAEVVRRWL
ncbi:hypothetical protein BC936DRAFT_149287 [Jimgerdemannia flammicorona]|uniref:AB hydrolase-1 domain-containing protein n=1 Tax=Jimgerdemannia flammicorona TaxID=994334 RepID=A0A433D151_9FUNG|nr:hypothetical protein BC936DRAFT_149287 [Jimgerdemannia flammicorona]